MEKKTKMWIAVGVVIMVVIGILISSLFLFSSKDNPEYEAEITIDVSKNETAYIINISELDVYYFNTNDLQGHSIGSPHATLKIIRENNTENDNWSEWFLKEKSERTGIKWIDVNNDNNVGQGDKIILYKSGGSEYSPKKGDLIKIEDSDNFLVWVSSNTIELP